MEWNRIFWFYIIIINIVAFSMMGIDKGRSRKGMWRIRERTFFVLASIGGGLGILLGINIFRHKTKHKSFTWGIPIILILQFILLFLGKYPKI